MASGNTEQIADWNGAQGRRWAELQKQTDGIVLPFGEAALKVAAARAGERAIDVGCGCGDTSFELARHIGPTGRVLGVDVSRPMLDVARQRERPAGSAALEFREADASSAELPRLNDLLFSRFGVMFFDQPVPAFQHLRASMKSGGRFVFVCWRTPRDNDWAMLPLAAARQATGITLAPSDPTAPGPFAFADEPRLRSILAEAGFVHVDVQRFDALVTLGPSARSAAQNALRIGPTSRFVRELGDDVVLAVTDTIEIALAPMADADGTVRLKGSTWIVSALNP